MAKNQVYRETGGRNRSVTVTHPTSPVSGGPCRHGSEVGVALTTEDANGLTTVAFDGVWLLSVKGIDGAGNSAVAPGDRLYYVDADTPPISKKNTGYFIGVATEAKKDGTTYSGTLVASGATTTIPVEVTGTGTGIPPVSA